ncbi:MAG: class I SAM-dependent methyltransferase [Gammaproteobacteria bacterium]|nr:MAG: class I SAM-dependent methyltransferase [Gammaproteobacteria bacterium]
MWDQRYSANEYVYGKQPNDFLREVIERIPRGRVLCLAEGEGRNAVFLAEQGCEVLAVDASTVGLAKAMKLAGERGVSIHVQQADLADFQIMPESWDAIVSIFCHVPPAIRGDLHRRVVAGLKPGGLLVLEAYTPDQIALGTGGPPVPELTMTLAALTSELEGLEFLHAIECRRDVIEGIFHTGCGAVVQVLGHKPLNSVK